MARLLIQSRATGRFLAPSLTSGVPEWVVSLDHAGGGVVSDVEDAIQLLEDNTDLDDQPVIVDLDRLGTPADYMHF
jgi:hypothetical protein